MTLTLTLTLALAIPQSLTLFPFPALTLKPRQVLGVREYDPAILNYHIRVIILSRDRCWECANDPVDENIAPIFVRVYSVKYGKGPADLLAVRAIWF